MPVDVDDRTLDWRPWKIKQNIKPGTSVEGTAVSQGEPPVVTA